MKLSNTPINLPKFNFILSLCFEKRLKLVSLFERGIGSAFSNVDFFNNEPNLEDDFIYKKII